MSSAGTTSTRARATPSPPLVNLCTRPAGTTTVSPASAVIFFIPSRNVIVPFEHVEALLLLGVHVRAGHATVAPRARARTRAARPPVSAAVCMNVMRSPLTGFSIVCPVKAIVEQSSKEVAGECDKTPGNERGTSSACLTIRRHLE